MIRTALVAILLSLPLAGTAQGYPPPQGYPPAQAYPGQQYPSPSEPGAPSTSAAEVLARYDLDGDARDAVRRGPDGALAGAPRPAEDRLGNPAGALALGGRDYVDLGVRVEPEQFSIALWVRPGRVDRDMALFSKSAGRDRLLELRQESGGRIFLRLPSGRFSEGVRTNRALAPGRWTQVVATYDGGRAAIYLDGRLDGEGSLPPFEATRGPIFLGARPEPNGRRARPLTYFEGRLDEVILYRGALGALEAQALAAPPRPGPRHEDPSEDRYDVIRVARLVAAFDAACARRDAQALGRIEAQAVEEIEAEVREARAERQPGAKEKIQRLERARQELASNRNRLDAMSLDKKRAILAELSEFAWLELIEKLDNDPWTSARRYDDRRDADWR